MTNPIDTIYKYRATVVRVTDGDTVRLSIDLGFHVTLTISGRLLGVNAPELHGDNKEAGQAARQFLIDLFHDQPDLPPQVMVQSYKNRQTFARWVVDIWLPDGRRVTDTIIEAGHGEAADDTGVTRPVAT